MLIIINKETELLNSIDGKHVLWCGPWASLENLDRKEN